MAEPKIASPLKDCVCGVESLVADDHALICPAISVLAPAGYDRRATAFDIREAQEIRQDVQRRPTRRKHG